MSVLLTSMSALLCETEVKSIDQAYQSLQNKENTCISKSKTQLDVIEIRLHLAQDRCQFVQDETWIKWQIDQSNQLFSEIGICFEIKTILPLATDQIEMKDQTMRTAIGQKRLKSGAIDVFVVGRLADIDIKGEEIRGVHWRHPKDRQKQRWIILSKIARDFVLAHELGHYFDLPHSTYESSIMNKTPRDFPISKRGFVVDEYSIMKKAKERMFQDEHLCSIRHIPSQP
jgi:hypothetical protein